MLTLNIYYLKLIFLRKFVHSFFMFFFHSPNNKHIVDDWCSRNCDDALNITIFFASTNICWEGFFLITRKWEIKNDKMWQKLSYVFLGKQMFLFSIHGVLIFFQNIWFFIALFELWYFSIMIFNRIFWNLDWISLES